MQQEQPHSSSTWPHEPWPGQPARSNEWVQPGCLHSHPGGLWVHCMLQSHLQPSLALGTLMASPTASGTAGRRDRGAPGSSTTVWWLMGEIQAGWGDTSHRQKEKGKTCQLAVIRAATQSRRHLQNNMSTVISLAAQQGPAPHAHQIYSLPEIKVGLRSKQSWGRSAKSCPSMNTELLALIECKQAPRLLPKAEALHPKNCSPSLLTWGKKGWFCGISMG